MPQAQHKAFPGYGVVYPDGVRGIKVVGTFTDGAKKTIHPGGSVSYSAPSPVIHELYGGGFCYADGNAVTNREHLEAITDLKMKERGLEWFDTHGKVIVSPQDDIPPLDQDGKVRPEPAFILSNQLPEETDEVTKSINEQVQAKSETDNAVMKAITDLATMVKQQGEEIAKLKVGPAPEPKPEKKPRGEKNVKQAEIMKARWADPAFRERMAKRLKKTDAVGEGEK